MLHSKLLSHGALRERMIGSDSDDLPVNFITRSDAVDFANKLNSLSESKAFNVKGYCFRLLVEAEWEYVCLAGRSSKEHEQSVSSETANIANPGIASSIGIMKVGSFDPNPFGVYDMDGNVSEWCADFLYGDKVYDAYPYFYKSEKGYGGVIKIPKSLIVVTRGSDFVDMKKYPDTLKFCRRKFATNVGSGFRLVGFRLVYGKIIPKLEGLLSEDDLSEEDLKKVKYGER